jgi:hypothetical protein
MDADDDDRLLPQRHRGTEGGTEMTRIGDDGKRGHEGP